MKHLFVTTLLFGITCIASFAQSFSAKIEDVGGYYRLSFTVTSSDASGFTPPSLAAFEVLSGPSTSTFSSYQMVNGHSSHSETTSYTYILSAKKPGQTTIGSASIRVGNRTLHSHPISVNVRVSSGNSSSNGRASSSNNASSNSMQGANEVQQIGSAVTARDLFIDVTPSRTRVREQEAVLLTYRIHSRVGVGLANTQLSTKPDFKGLISQEIPLPGNQIQTNIEHRNGTTYRTGTILQYVIFPQHSGRIEIPSITFDCTVVQQDHSMDFADAFFNGGGSVGVQVRRTVPITSIQVDALPQPKPSNFSGAVGKFSIQGKVLNQVVKTNDVATYRITLNGLGNLKLITAPKVTFPTDFDTYDAKTNENTHVTANGLTGQLTFDYTFVPRNVGKYTIPTIDFVYFDTESGSYKTISTKPITLDVKKGERSNADVEKQLALLRSDIRDIQTDANQSNVSTIFAWGNLGYWLLIVVLCFIFALVMHLLMRYATSQADVVGRRRSGANRQALKRLREAEKLITSPSPTDFYAAVSKALIGYLADSLNVGQADLTHGNIQRMLAERGASPESINAFINVLDTCQYAQYAPATDSQRSDVYQQAIHAIEGLKLSRK